MGWVPVVDQRSFAEPPIGSRLLPQRFRRTTRTRIPMKGTARSSTSSNGFTAISLLWPSFDPTLGAFCWKRSLGGSLQVGACWSFTAPHAHDRHECLIAAVDDPKRRHLELPEPGRLDSGTTLPLSGRPSEKMTWRTLRATLRLVSGRLSTSAPNGFVISPASHRAIGPPNLVCISRAHALSSV